MTEVIRVSGLTRKFGKQAAVDNASFTIERDAIHGLLGRNGAGKTTLMQLLTAQDFPTSGSIEVFGKNPVENASVLRRMCFIKESQRYPDEFKVRHVLESAPWFFANWSESFANDLVEEFDLPREKKLKKLSRGQLSAVGVIVGLASRAPITFFDEPYLGLDAVARQLFYDRLLADYAENPRTVILSTHLIDEVSNLLERVIVIDHGRIVLDEQAESIRGRAFSVSGTSGAVDDFASTRKVLHTSRLGGLSTATVESTSADDRKAAAAAGLEVSPVSLQQLIIQKTSSTEREFEHSA